MDGHGPSRLHAHHAGRRRGDFPGARQRKQCDPAALADRAGAPAQFGLGRIRPFSFLNGTHFCSLDWHTISLVFVDVGSYAVVSAELAPFVWSYTLDGAPLASETTAVKRFDPEALLAFVGEREGYWRGGGAVVSPATLPVGTHTVHLVVTDSSTGAVIFDDAVTFVMDAAGTGACA